MQCWYMIQLSKRVAALTIYTGNVSFGKLETFESAHTEYCMNPIPVSFSKASQTRCRDGVMPFSPALFLYYRYVTLYTQESVLQD